jgi:hypothetical protein
MRWIAVGCAAAVAATAVGVTAAGGQSAGPPSGTLSFKVVIKENAGRRDRKNLAIPGDKERPRVADLEANNVDVLSTDGQRIGIAHNFDITTFEGAKKYKGRAVTIGDAVVDFGGGNLLFAQCIREDSPTNNNCAILGGTGRFAGARGSAVEDAQHAVEDKKNKTFTVPINVTFMP